MKILTIEKKDRTKSVSSKAKYKITPKVKEVFEDLKINQDKLLKTIMLTRFFLCDTKIH